MSPSFPQARTGTYSRRCFGSVRSYSKPTAGSDRAGWCWKRGLVSGRENWGPPCRGCWRLIWGIYPRNFIIIEKVVGVSLSEVDVGLGERRRLVREAGWAIRAVHEIGVPGFGLLHEATYLRNAQVRGEYDTWEEHVNRVLGVTLPALRSGGGWDDAGGDRIDRLFSDHASYFELGPVGHLLHGTFDPARVIVNEGQVTGLVGFGERSSGDPAWDLGGFLIGTIADTRDLLEGYDPDKEQAAASR